MARRIKMPWTKRAEAEQQLREEAEERYQKVVEDWAPLKKHKKAIDREVELNDWTRTAIYLFSDNPPPESKTKAVKR